MKLSNAAILTTEGGWFENYAYRLLQKIQEKGLKSELFFDASKIPDLYEVVFMLSVYKLVKKKDLERHRHNLVIHPSALPKGKGWSPLAWQLLEGKNEIPIVMFEAEDSVDAGAIYMKDTIHFDGTELHDEIREKQGNKLIEMSLRFIDEYESIEGEIQNGESTYYPKRTSRDSEIDIHKPLIEQINLLRICNNHEYPPFFYYKEKKYILNIFKEVGLE